MASDERPVVTWAGVCALSFSNSGCVLITDSLNHKAKGFETEGLCGVRNLELELFGRHRSLLFEIGRGVRRMLQMILE